MFEVDVKNMTEWREGKGRTSSGLGFWWIPTAATAAANTALSKLYCPKRALAADGLKKCSSFKKSVIFDGQNGQKMTETHDEICLDPQNPLFCIKDKKTIYTKCRPYMGLHLCQLPGLLKKF